MNLLQNIVDAVLGADVLNISDVDPTVLFLSCLFMIVLSLAALRSLFRTFTNLRFLS